MFHCGKCKKDRKSDEYYYRKDGSRVTPCKECTKERIKLNATLKTTEEKREKWNEWAKKNKEHLNDYSRQYRIDNKETVQKISQRYRESKKEDIQYKTASSLRKKLIYYVIQKPSDDYISLFSASPNYIRLWIEYQFTTEMNWENYGTYWNFDHIIPYDNHDLTIQEEILKCCHWSNIQPLLCSENSSKINKIDKDLIEAKKQLANKFEQEF